MPCKSYAKPLLKDTAWLQHDNMGIDMVWHWYKQNYISATYNIHKKLSEEN